MARVEVIHGDMRDVLGRMVAEGKVVQSVVTDAPYGLAFMGRKWDEPDNLAFRPGTWRLCFELLPPGGHLLAFAGTRTYHRMAVAIEEAGFEIRDTIAWLYGSGFPKSHNVSKGIDKMGAIDVAAFKGFLSEAVKNSGKARSEIDTACGFTMRFDTAYAADPIGWGVSLPSPEKWQKICTVLGLDPSAWSELIDRVWRGRAGAKLSQSGSMSGSHYERTDLGEAATDAARQWDGWGTALKPAMELICVARKPLDGTVAANVLKHGTGALNIAACRVGTTKDVPASGSAHRLMNGYGFGAERGDTSGHDPNVGRWPANVCHDGNDEVVSAFPETQSGVKEGGQYQRDLGVHNGGQRIDGTTSIGDSGSAARFFYSSKADSDDRLGSKHPTVKPVDLMRWLVRLITPPGGICLDPFAGSGTTGMACMAEGFDCILIEREAEYVADIKARIAHVHGEDTPLFSGVML